MHLPRTKWLAVGACIGICAKAGPPQAVVESGAQRLRGAWRRETPAGGRDRA